MPRRLHLIAFLLAITTLALIAHSIGMNSRLPLTPATTKVSGTTDDRLYGGASIATTTLNDNYWDFTCELATGGSTHTFCSFFIDFRTSNTHGLDLSGFDHVNIKLRTPLEQSAGLTLVLRNFHPTLSTPGLPHTYKPNNLDVYARTHDDVLRFDLKQLRVPLWWLIEREAQFSSSKARIDNVLWIELTTPAFIADGHYAFEIESIEFTGKWISRETLIFILLSLWGLAGAGFALLQILNARNDLKQSQARQHQLEALNRLLNVKSQRLTEQLNRDKLTGAYNREGIAHLFDGVLNAKNLAIIFIDIDYFKVVNDTFGHAMGDAILREFAELIGRNTRDSDVLARWGGEEFVLACPDTTLTHASLLAEKLRAQIAAHTWPHNNPLSASFGVAVMRADESPTEFIARADGALYGAKHAGRNCVVIANS